MEKKRILIAMQSLHIGGAERSLINLLKSIDPEKCQVDLFLFWHAGELMDEIPEYVQVLPEIPAYAFFSRSLKETLLHGHGMVALSKLYARSMSAKQDGKHGYASFYCQYFMRNHLPQINPDVCYYAAISYRTPHFAVLNAVQAKKKYAWIHTDYTKIPIDHALELKMWSRFDRIAAVSDSCAETFADVFPSLKDKLLTIENITIPEDLHKAANAFDVSAEMPRNDGELIFCSVGRFAPAKNFDSIPNICARLIEKGFRIKWYLIGFGGEETKIRNAIADAKMQEHVIILGKRENTAPYIATCDFYLQPSRFEGKAVTVLEAQCLKKLVITANYPTAPSQIDHEVNGWIFPIENEAFASAVADLLGNRDRIECVKNNLLQSDFGNAYEVEKLYQLLP